MNRPTTITLGKISRPKLSRDGRTMVVSIPISFRRQGGQARGHSGKCADLVASPAPRRQYADQSRGARSSLAQYA